MKTKKFTILHSNDMHGDFLAEVKAGEGKLIGGLSLLSGYINKVRAEEENVIYVISGDMVQGSLIDSEYKGISTMEIMNFLAPDVVALGNHEFDYGLPHLLFLEKVANFPIVNANLYISQYNKRLMLPYVIIKKAGFDILFTGIVTEKVIDSISQDKLISSFVTLQEASKEIGLITDAYKNDDIDLTIVLTHIGFDSDIELAKLIDPKWGIDLIIGGHSHTILEQPAKENGIYITQAGVGTDQIGRFDITVDDDTNSIIDMKWQLIAIDENIAEPDKDLEKYINTFKEDVDRKYSSIVTKLSKKLTHPLREEETELGNYICDAFAQIAETDVMLLGSGSVRVKEIGPVVTLKDIMSCFPYDDSLTRHTVSGKNLKKMFSHFMRRENRNGEGECYQVNSGIKAVYDDNRKELVSLEIGLMPVEDEKTYKVCMQGYHFNNSEAYLRITNAELLESGKSKVISTSAQQVLIEYMKNNQNKGSAKEGRLQYKN